MKELETQSGIGDIEIVNEVKKEIEKQLKYVGHVRPHSGHKCFEINLKTGEANLAEFKEEAISFEDAKNGIVSGKKKIIIKEDCVYITALNKKNAIKKLYKKNN